MNLSKSEKRILLAIAVAVAMALVLILHSFLSATPLTVSEPVWECASEADGWHCGVEFEIGNESSEQQLVEFVVRSQRWQKRAASQRLPTVEIIGQHTYQREIDADSLFRFSKTLRLEEQPDTIIVTVVCKSGSGHSSASRASDPSRTGWYGDGF